MPFEGDINASVGDWRTHLFGSNFKLSFLIESQSPYSILPLGNYPNQLFRLQIASISNLDYYFSRYFTQIRRSYILIAKETISRQCKMECCDCTTKSDSEINRTVREYHQQKKLRTEICKKYLQRSCRKPEQTKTKNRFEKNIWKFAKL